MMPMTETPTLSPPVRAQATVMLSRVAHSLYWMSRYIERAENIARLLEVNLQFHFDLQGMHVGEPGRNWRSLVLSSGSEVLFDGFYSETNSHTVTDFLAFDLRNPCSIIASVYAARENARMVRDQISLEMWETINDLHLFLKSHDAARVW